MNFRLWLGIVLEMLGVWNLGICALMLLGTDVGILILSVYHLLEIGRGGRMRSEMRASLQFQRRGRVGSFPRDASRGLRVSGVTRM
jgi:hypothetical protein